MSAGDSRPVPTLASCLARDSGRAFQQRMERALAVVALGFDSTDVHGLLDAFVARYGRWSRMVEREFVTKADQRFRSALWIWHLPHVEIRLEQDRGTLGHGQATVMWDSGLKEFRARERTWQVRYEDEPGVASP